MSNWLPAGNQPLSRAVPKSTSVRKLNVSLASEPMMSDADEDRRQRRRRTARARSARCGCAGGCLSRSSRWSHLPGLVRVGQRWWPRRVGQDRTIGAAGPEVGPRTSGSAISWVPSVRSSQVFWVGATWSSGRAT